MTTSYVLERQQELRDNKKLMREAERQAIAKMEEEQALRKAASDARIKAKLERIERGEPAPAKVEISAPEPAKAEVIEETPPEPKVKPKAKAAPKKKPAARKK